MLKALIFDFDGVIGDTYDINFKLLRELYPQISEQDFQDHHNGNVFNGSKIKFRAEDIPVLFKRQRELFREDMFFPIVTQLQDLAQTYKLFVVSSTSDTNIMKFLEIAGVLDYFTQILGANTHTSKIEKFKIILDKYTLSVHECIFITDTIGDIKEANHINLRTIAVTWGYHSKELLHTQNPFALVNNADELSHIIRTIS